MLSAKDESFSRRKGKEATTDDLPLKAMGREALHSKLDHSEEEEGGHDPGSECPPPIDSWYDTHIHFSVASSDYSPPLPGRVWLSLCCRDFKVSWPP